MSSGQQDAPALLNELEAKLRTADCILEPGVLDVLKAYIRAGGKAGSAVNDLSENYIGLAKMSETMCEWLQIAEVHGTEPVSTTSHSSSIARAYSGSLGGSSSRSFLAGGAAPGVAGNTTGDGGVPDAFTLLQEMAKKQFDSTMFLSVFKKGHPEWLDQLIQDPRGRRLIYELSAANRNSLLLNYAIQRILKQGHEDEVASVGGSLASYFEVYHRLLATRLSAATRATSSQQLCSIAREISESCVANQHTYVHAQQLLTALSQLPGGSVFKRLSQEVEAAAAARQGGIKVYQLQPLFVPLSAPPPYCQAVHLVSGALMQSAPNLPGSGLGGGGGSGGSSSGGQPPPPSLVIAQLSAAEQPLSGLLQLYQQEAELSVEPLQHPQLMQLLLSGMFVASNAKPTTAPGSSNNSSSNKCSQRELCIQLLALAVAGRSLQGQLQEQEQEQEQQEQQQQQQQQQQQRRSLSPEAKGAEAVAELLQQTLQLSQKMASNKLKPADLDLATQVCRRPVCALGLLQHSKAVLGDAAAYAEEKMVVMLPNHLSVLHRVACEQPGLIPEVLGVLRCVLNALGSNKQELSKSVLSFLVSLMVSGAADLALQMAQSWSTSADPSLIRHFIQLVLESVEPPYSAAFARSMLSMMHTSLILRLKGSHTAMLHEFAAGCSAVVFLPPLSKKDQDLLDDLGS